MKKKSEFLSENFHFFFMVNFLVYLNRRIFVMAVKKGTTETFEKLWQY